MILVCPLSFFFSVAGRRRRRLAAGAAAGRRRWASGRAHFQGGVQPWRTVLVIAP